MEWRGRGEGSRLVQTGFLLPDSSLAADIGVVGGGARLVVAIASHLRRVAVGVVARQGRIDLAAVGHDDLVGLKNSTYALAMDGMRAVYFTGGCIL